MSYLEAKEDNIRYEKPVSALSPTKYYIPCSQCGTEVMSFSYIRGHEYICNECRLDIELFDKIRKIETVMEVKEKKFENAVERIRKKNKNMAQYKSAIEAVHKKLDKQGWFESTEEIMVAIELLKNKISLRHQVKLGRYRADFILPKLKVVLEIDGVIFHTERTRDKEEIRDNLIIAALGAEWEVIRISDERINQNITRLIPAIYKILEQRKIKRKANGGLLPKGYSKKTF